VPETELERARRAKACCQEFHESGRRNESRRQSCRRRCLARSEGSVLDGHGVCIVGMGVLDGVSDANPSEAAAACGHIIGYSMWQIFVHIYRERVSVPWSTHVPTVYQWG